MASTKSSSSDLVIDDPSRGKQIPQSQLVTLTGLAGTTFKGGHSWLIDAMVGPSPPR
jgi:hypothetical protein